jgi:hypothetical protein
VPPPVSKLLLFMSRARRVTVTEPPDARVVLETDTVELDAENAPTRTWTCGDDDVSADPLMVAPTKDGLPAITPVSVAV